MNWSWANVKLNRRQAHVVLAVTLGSILEWYDIYAYVYIAPILSQLFFKFQSAQLNLLLALVLFGIGALRPIGGMFFGHWGDLKGRRKPFISSIAITTCATLLMGLIGTYASWGIWAPLALVFLRIAQSLPESGEYVGAACFLYENADPQNRTFMASLAAIGNQLGAAIAIFEALVIDRFMSEEFLLAGGWRLIFFVGGLMGMFCVVLRRTLDETPAFKVLELKHEIDKEELRVVIFNHKRTIALGTAFGLVNSVSFYFIAAYLPVYFNKRIGLSERQNALVSLTIIILTTIMLPVFGILGSIFSKKKLLISSAIIIMTLLPFLYYFVNNRNLNGVLVCIYMFVVPISCITATLSFVLLHLFSTPVRFTGVGIAFNISSGLIGGFTPAVSIFLSQYFNNPAAFCWFVLICAAVSLLSYFKIRE